MDRVILNVAFLHFLSFLMTNIETNLTRQNLKKILSGVDSKLAYFTRTYVRGFVATRPFYSDIYVYHYVYICGVQRTADTSFSVLME